MYSVIFDETLSAEFEADIKPLLQDIQCEFIAFNEGFSASQVKQKKIMTWVPDEAFYTLLPLAAEAQWQVGFLPHPGMQRFYRSFLIDKEVKAALEDIENTPEPVDADLMLCNEKPVLSSVMIGDANIMKPAAKADDNIFSKFYNLMVVAFNVRKAELLQFKIKTAKDVQVETAALGLAMVYRPAASDFTHRVVGETEKDEASLHAVILAPRSMTQVFNYFLTRVLPKKRSDYSLPSYAGYIRTDAIEVASRQTNEYTLDGDNHEAESLTIRVEPNALKLLTSKMPEKVPESELKESVKTSKLPKGRVINELCGRNLPWIYHVDQDEVKETFVNLRENSRLSENFIVLMLLSTALATVGLFSNSTPVIIGAMILAPMMAPIISLSMGLLRQNASLVLETSKTLVIGILIALTVGVISTLVTPLSAINSEIASRLSPTLLDLGVAIFSGIAGAYASARSEVAKNLAGVAIAVALVPPLAVSAIGIGWWDWAVFSGAFLLFITNLIGMVLAAAATFLVMGFSPFQLAKKAFFWVTPLVVIVAIPLYFSFDAMVKEQEIKRQLEAWQYQEVVIRDVRIRKGKMVEVSAKLVVKEPLDQAGVKEIKNKVEELLGQPVRLEVVQAMVQ